MYASAYCCEVVDLHFSVLDLNIRCFDDGF